MEEMGTSMKPKRSWSSFIHEMATPAVTRHSMAAISTIRTDRHSDRKMRHDFATEPGGPRRDRPCAYTTQKEVTTRLYLRWGGVEVRNILYSARGGWGGQGQSAGQGELLSIRGAVRGCGPHMDSAIVEQAAM
eukprot:scaffold2931_cov154-Isochrysis_galbana.AAC.6